MSRGLSHAKGHSGCLLARDAPGSWEMCTPRPGYRFWPVGRMTFSNRPFPSKGDREEYFELIQVFRLIPCRK